MFEQLFIFINYYNKKLSRKKIEIVSNCFNCCFLNGTGQKFPHATSLR